MADRTLTVKIIGDERDLLRSLRTSSRATQRFSVGVGTFIKGAVVFEGVRRGIDALTGAVRSGTAEFSEMQKVAAQTNAVLSSTQGIANVSAEGVSRLAGNLSRLSGIDDELIQSGANLILTFKNIRNELGEGNAIFDRTTKAALDLSVAGFGSVESTAKQLGKALNDPVRGMTALSRAGVTFTQSQKDTIKRLVETNRFLDAQKLILREVESQVGGSARALGETLPGQLNKVREAFRNAFGNLVAAVAEPLAGALGAVARFIPQLEAGVARISATVGPALEGLVTAFTARLPELQRISSSVLDPLREHVIPVLRDVGAIVVQFWNEIVRVFSSRSGQLHGILSNLGQVLANVWAVARPTIVFLFTKALPAALNIAIPIIEKLTAVTKVMSNVFVRVVSVIVKSLDLFLGALSKLTDAASHLPFVGEQFKGISDRINAGRESLRQFAADLDALDGKTVKVSIQVDTTTGRREEGAAGHPTKPDKEVDKQTKAAEDGLDAQRKGAQRVNRKSGQATSETKKAETAAERQRNAFERLLGKLGIRRDAAAATRRLEDDLRVLRDIEKALLAQIKVEGRTNELVGQLQEVRQERAQLVRQQRQGRQFEALGLTAEGEKRVPSAGALKRRLGTLQQQIKGTTLDTKETRAQLARISKVLSGQFGKVGRDVRLAILAMFQEIADALDEGSGSRGPLTKTSGLNTKKIVEGLGLTVDQINELRGRLSSVSTSKQFSVGAPRTVTTGGFGGAQGTILVESHTTINLDGERVAKVVTRNQQRQRRRNPKQKRGPNRNR